MMQADYSPRAKRRDGGQQTRPISADVGRLFAVEEHSNERTGTSAVSGASSSGSHAAGGFKKGKEHKFYIIYQYFQLCFLSLWFSRLCIDKTIFIYKC